MVQRNSAEKLRPSQPALLPGLLFLTLALVLCGVAFYRASLPAFLKPLLFQLASALLVASAGFLSAFLTDWARRRGLHVRKQIKLPELKRPLPRVLEETRVRAYRAANKAVGIDWKGDWLPLSIAALLAALSLAAAIKGWRTDGPVPPVSSDQWIVGVLTLLAFPMLVLERRFAVADKDGSVLLYLVRLLLVTPLLLALSYVLRWFALPFGPTVEHVVVIFCGLVAGEILLRCASYLFLPLPPLATRQNHAVIVIASLLRLQRPSLKAIGASMNKQFGIDLGRSWALGFIRRAALPMAGGLIVAGWLLTGVTALDLSQRAVYEQFGTPWAVFHSGLHVYLPWPFGKLRPIEYGVVHEIPVAFPDEDEYPSKADNLPEHGPIEGPPPEGVDRLWEASRPTEASYLVASNENGRESFEVLNIDLRIAYRIGLSDEAATSAAYSLDAPDALIRAAAGRMLARYFARSTVAGVLGQNRENFIRGFQKELQERLNSLTASIDIMSVVIETIHPPAGVADAYQEAQAASIEAITKVANAKGDAARDVHQAESDATEARDTATAQAAETVASAKVGTALFAGDVQANKQGGAAFLFERRLSDIAAAITPETKLLVVDHRIPASQTSSLMSMKAPGTPNPGSSEQ